MSLNGKNFQKIETVALEIIRTGEILIAHLDRASKAAASNNVTLFNNNQGAESRKICLEAIQSMTTKTKEVLENIHTQKGQTQNVTQATVNPSKASG